MIRGEVLGEGTFGKVYSAFSPHSNKEYAIKRNFVENTISFNNQVMEIDLLSRLRDHPFIVKIELVHLGSPFRNQQFSPIEINDTRKSQRDDGLHFVFNKAKHDLFSYIYNQTDNSFGLTKKYMVNMLLGTEYCHFQKIIHRDLKPGNILIFPEPENFTPNDVFDPYKTTSIAQLCDFGLAKPYTYQGSQTPHVETSWYRAPEVTLGYPHYDYKIDTWALGCILYELVSKTPFIHCNDDDNDVLLSLILGKLPKPISLRTKRELVTSNKWRSINLKSSADNNNRKSFEQLIGFDDKNNKLFEQQNGKLSIFCDLLDNMLKFVWDDRYTITQCLDHPFFAEYRSYIAFFRTKYQVNTIKCPLSESYQVNIKYCIERQWMSDMAMHFYSSRNKYSWYTHRILFQTMDIFDRFIFTMANHTKINDNAIESEFKGLLFDKTNTQLIFLSFLYLSIKFFNSINLAVPFTSVCKHYAHICTPDKLVMLAQFESDIIVNFMNYRLYRQTIYEAADEYNEYLSEKDVGNLVYLYTQNKNLSGLTNYQVYLFYRDNLLNANAGEISRAVPK